MKRLKFLLITMLLPLCFIACKDDKKTEEEGGGRVPETDKVAVAFVSEGVTALRNAGTIRIPVALAEAAEGTVKFSVAVVPASGTRAAKEGYDFQVVEKVLNMEAGKTENYVEVSLLDNEKVTEDKEFEVEINTVYGYGKKGATKQRCKITIVSNSFVEFDKAEWFTWEAAAVSGDESIRKTRRIPVKVNGTITEPATLKIGVTDETALEYTHFELASKSVTVNPGDEYVYVEVEPIDDSEANIDRRFTLTLEDAEGGNLRLGKNNLDCNVTIQSEEVVKTASFLLPVVKVAEDSLLAIEVVLDKVANEDVTLAFSVNDGTALTGVNYELLTPVVTLKSGSKKAVVQLEIKKDGLCATDKDFELSLVDADGSHTFVSEDKYKCKVTIENRDYPSFAVSSVQVLENTELYKIAVSLENPAPVDVPLDFSVEDIEGVAGTDFKLLTPSVTIPAGATSANVEIQMGFTLAQFKASKFTLSVDQVFGQAIAEEITTEVGSKERSTYRKLLGTWTHTANRYNNSATATPNFSFDVVVIAGSTEVEQAANFGKKLLVKGWIDHSVNFYNNIVWSMDFDEQTETIKRNFGPMEGTFVYSSASRNFWTTMGDKYNGGWIDMTAAVYSNAANHIGKLNLEKTEITFTANANAAFILTYYAPAGSTNLNSRVWAAQISMKDVVMTKK